MGISRYKPEFRANEGCVGNCNKDTRKVNAPHGICAITKSVTDGIPVRCVGEWAIQKLYFIYQYLNIFAVGMHNNWNVVYIEIGSGPGKCIARESGCEFDGTALCAIKSKAFDYIDHALFFDINQEVIDILNQRLQNLNATKAHAYYGDYTNPSSIIDVVKKYSNTKDLNLIVIDPTDCSVPFSFIRDIKSVVPRSDFIINVAIGTDFNRNVNQILQDPHAYSSSKLKYEQFLGDSTFFQKLNIEQTQQEKKIIFLETYKESLKKLGYEYVDGRSVKWYYYILFASSNPRGLDFFKKALHYEPDGQMSLF